MGQPLPLVALIWWHVMLSSWWSVPRSTRPQPRRAEEADRA